jgi:hypothetical protein
MSFAGARWFLATEHNIRCFPVVAAIPMAGHFPLGQLTLDTDDVVVCRRSCLEFAAMNRAIWVPSVAAPDLIRYVFLRQSMPPDAAPLGRGEIDGLGAHPAYVKSIEFPPPFSEIGASETFRGRAANSATSAALDSNRVRCSPSARRPPSASVP